jgi:hypothetical protein
MQNTHGAADEFLDEKSLAQVLGINPNTAAKWRVRRYGPPFIKVGS